MNVPYKKYPVYTYRSFYILLAVLGRRFVKFGNLETKSEQSFVVRDGSDVDQPLAPLQ